MILKIRYFLIVFFLSFPLSMFAQEFLLGAKGGLQGFKTSFGKKDEVEGVFRSLLKGGLNGGAFIVFPLPDDFSFVFETNYSVKGRRIRFNEGLNGEWINSSKYYFLEMPILLRKAFPVRIYNFPSYWYINAGANVSYWLKGAGKLTTIARDKDGKQINNGITLDYSLEFNDVPVTDVKVMYLSDVNRWLFGLDFGIGYSAHVLGNQRFFAEARFTYGHTYLGEKNSVKSLVLGYIDNMESNYRVLNLSFGYAINLNFQDLKKGKSTMDKETKKKRR